MRRLAPSLVLLLVAGPLSGAEPPIDSGRFTVFAAGREAGYEVFSLRRTGGELLLTSRALLSRGGREQELELEARFDAETGDLLRFAADGVSGETTRSARLVREEGRFRGEVREGEVARPVNLPAEPGAVPLVDPFAAPYLLLARGYDRASGVPVTVPAVFPLKGRTGGVKVVMREAQALTIDDRVELATRLLATPNEGDVANLWVREDGRLLVCARSAAGLSAVRGSAVGIGLKPGEDPPCPEGVTALRVRFAGDGPVLAGTIYRPERLSGRAPAVLLLSGSGPQDRNGNAPGTELQWSNLATLADGLAKEGVASFRYDERGVGRSGGTFADAGLSDLYSDAASALDYLATREDVDPDRIGILGHSEGAILAAKLAGAGEPKVAAVALLGAPAERLDRMLIEQVRARLADREMTERERQRILGDLRAFFTHVRLSTADQVTWNGRRREVKWFREHMETDPLRVYARVRVPALVVQGGRDVQVPPEHAERVRAALGGPGRASILRFPSLDHFLMMGTGHLADYADARRRVAPLARIAIAKWLATRLRAR